MRNSLKIALIAGVVVLVGVGFIVKSFLSAVNEAEADTRAFFQTIVDQGSGVAYDQTSDYFKEATTFEDFDGFVQNVGMVDFTDFQASGYEASTANGLTTKTINGTIMFNDDTSVDIYFDWVKVGEEWKVLGFGAAVE